MAVVGSAVAAGVAAGLVAAGVAAATVGLVVGLGVGVVVGLTVGLAVGLACTIATRVTIIWSAAILLRKTLEQKVQVHCKGEWKEGRVGGEVTANIKTETALVQMLGLADAQCKKGVDDCCDS